MGRKPRDSIRTESMHKQVSKLFDCVDDPVSLLMFQKIIAGKASLETMGAESGLTRKMFYSRMSLFKQLNLVKRKQGGFYTPTTMGQILGYLIIMAYYASMDYWRIKTVDSILDSEMPDKEKRETVEKLVPHKEIAKIILLALGPEPEPGEENAV